MRINKSQLNQLANSVSTLPEGYTVKTVGFQKHELYFNGEFVKVYESKRYAHNGAQRHSMGQQA
jgi:hypothetical protein